MTFVRATCKRLQHYHRVSWLAIHPYAVVTVSRLQDNKHQTTASRLKLHVKAILTMYVYILEHRKSLVFVFHRLS